MSAPSLYKDSFKAAQRASLDLHTVPCPQERPWFAGKPGSDNRPYRVNLGIVHRYGRAVATNDSNDAGNRENRKSMMKIQAAKHVTGKQGGVNHLDPIRPDFAAAVKRNEWVIPFAAEKSCDAQLVFRMHL
jgi:hypothetical protein